MFASFVFFLFIEMTGVLGSNRLVENFVLYPRMAIKVETLDCLFKGSQLVGSRQNGKEMNWRNWI
jgi:hypothetical protein